MDYDLLPSQQTRDVQAMLAQCWASVEASWSNIEPALAQRFVFAGMQSPYAVILQVNLTIIIILHLLALQNKILILVVCRETIFKS